MSFDMLKMATRSVIAAAITLGFVTLPATAQDKIPYPHKVVTLTTSSSPGGGSDVMLRNMTKYLSKVIDAEFVVENVVGGSGAKAMAYMSKQKADGSVFYAATPSYIYQSLMNDLEADYQDLDPLANLFYDTQVIYTRYDGPFQTLQDVIEHAKTARTAWGGGGASSLERVTIERMKKITGVNASIITSDGGGENMINVLNGTQDVGLGDYIEILPQVEAKQLRVLAVLGDTEVPELPGVPTAKEAGVDLVVHKFRGLAGPKGLPQEIIDIWNQAIPRLLADPEYKAEYEAAGLVDGFVPHDEYVKFIEGFGTEQHALLAEFGVIQK